MTRTIFLIDFLVFPKKTVAELRKKLQNRKRVRHFLQTATLERVVVVYRLYMKYKDCEWLYIIPLVLLNLGKILLHFYWLLTSGRGFPHAADSKWYIDYANSLIANFSIGLQINDILYFGYNILLALLLAVFKETTPILFIQALTAGLSIILVYKIAVMLFNRTTAIIASLFYYNLYDIQLWTTYILSESFFISLLLLCVYFALKALNQQTKRQWALFAFSVIYLSVFRPTGVIIAAAILTYVLLQQNTLVMKGFLLRYKLTLGFALSAAVAASAYMAVTGRLEPFSHSLQHNIKMVLYNVYAKGWLYDLATPYDYHFKADYRINCFDSLALSFLLNNWEHVLVLYAKRTLAFLGKWVWQVDCSSLKGIFLFAANALPTILFAAGTAVAVIKSEFRRTSVLWLIVFATYVFCTLLFIDWMYRYRSPATPFIAIIAAYGADAILRGIAAKVKEMWGYYHAKRRTFNRCPGI